MTQAERPEQSLAANVSAGVPETTRRVNFVEQISEVFRAHVPQPRIGGRASFFLSIHPVLLVDIPTVETTRKITITASMYPTNQRVSVSTGDPEYDKKAEELMNPKPRYTIADSLQQGRAILVDSKGVFLEKIEPMDEQHSNDNSSQDTDPHTALKELLEDIRKPECVFTHTFHVSGREGVPVVASEDENDVVTFDVLRTVYGVIRRQDQPSGTDELEEPQDMLPSGPQIID